MLLESRIYYQELQSHYKQLGLEDLIEVGGFLRFFRKFLGKPTGPKFFGPAASQPYVTQLYNNNSKFKIDTIECLNVLKFSKILPDFNTLCHQKWRYLKKTKFIFSNP